MFYSRKVFRTSIITIHTPQTSGAERKKSVSNSPCELRTSAARHKQNCVCAPSTSINTGVVSAETQPSALCKVLKAEGDLPGGTGSTSVWRWGKSCSQCSVRSGGYFHVCARTLLPPGPSGQDSLNTPWTHSLLFSPNFTLFSSNPSSIPMPGLSFQKTKMITSLSCLKSSTATWKTITRLGENSRTPNNAQIWLQLG